VKYGLDSCILFGSVFVCSRMVLKLTAAVSLNNISSLVFAAET
jgi:hypothetical protein